MKYLQFINSSNAIHYITSILIVVALIFAFISWRQQNKLKLMQEIAEFENEQAQLDKEVDHIQKVIKENSKVAQNEMGKQLKQLENQAHDSTIVASEKENYLKLLDNKENEQKQLQIQIIENNCSVKEEQDELNKQQKQNLCNTTLTIQQNNSVLDLIGIAPVGVIRELHLKLCKNIALKGIDELSNTLRILRVVDCELKQLDGVEKCQLDELHVGENQISTLKPLETVSTLQVLDISNNQIASSLELWYIINNKKLNKLKIYGNEMENEKEFEDRWMFAVPDAIQEVYLEDDKNCIDEWKTAIIESVKFGLDPFVEWRLELRLNALDCENKDLDQQIATAEQKNKSQIKKLQIFRINQLK